MILAVDKHDSSHCMFITKERVKAQRMQQELSDERTFLFWQSFSSTVRPEVTQGAKRVPAACRVIVLVSVTSKTAPASLFSQFLQKSVSCVFKNNLLSAFLIMCRNVITDWILKISKRVFVGNMLNLHQGTISEFSQRTGRHQCELAVHRPRQLPNISVLYLSLLR